MTDDQPPPPPRRNESAAEFWARARYLAAMVAPAAGWPERRGGDIAYAVEALGLGPDDFEAILRIAHAATPGYLPAGLYLSGYHFNVCRPDQVHGEPLGVYLRVVVAARAATPR